MRIFKKGLHSSTGQEGESPADLFVDSTLDHRPAGGAPLPPPSALQVGAFLRQMRERQGFSIGDISRRTRIRDVYLLALEAGEVEKLPGATFVAGFLRLYGESLQLEDTSVIERYLERSANEDNLHTELFPAPRTLRHRPSVWMVLGGMSGLLLLFFVYENYFSNFSLTARSPALPSVTPRRADTMPVHSGMRSADLSEPFLEGELEPAEAPSGMIAGMLARFFEWPSENSGGMAQLPPPEPVAPLLNTGQPKGVTSQGNSANGVAVPSSSVPEVAAGADPLREEQETLSSITASWIERGKEWFEQIGQPTPPKPDVESDAFSVPHFSSHKGSVSVKLAVGAVGNTERDGEAAKQTAVASSDRGPSLVVAGKMRSPAAASRPESLEPALSSELQMPPSREASKAARPEVDAKPVVTEWLVSKPVLPETIVPLDPIINEPVVATTAVVQQGRGQPVGRGGRDAVRLIRGRYQEKVSSAADLQPESAQAVSLLADEMVWVQIQDDKGQVLKDMVMQPNHLFRVPLGGKFFAVLGNAGAIRLRIGKRVLPYLGGSGAELNGVELSAEALLRRVTP